jgi:hypothetical protein
MKDKMKSLRIDAGEVGKHLGKQEGLILRALVETAGLKRVCVAGGDTGSLRRYGPRCSSGR